MDCRKYVDLGLGLQLKEKGFDEMCEHMFINHRRVKDEIQVKYPGLSDCGYDELTKKWGGELEEDEVYGQYVDPYRECIRNSWIKPDEKMRLCAMPTLDDARRWLRDNYKIHVVVEPQADYYKAVAIVPNKFGVVGVGMASITVYNPRYKATDDKATRFEDYDDAVREALREVMCYVKKDKTV